MEQWNEENPPALARMFEAPDEEYIGEFGWLCGYSADSVFLNAAAERFSTHVAIKRARIGRIILAVMLDPGNPQIKPTETPGVLHLPYREPSAGRPFNLLHAKVALLGFRPIDRSKKSWIIKLIVSTGNWTRQTLQDSLDLVWVTEVDTGKIDIGDKSTMQQCADISAAWGLLSRIKKWFDQGMLNAKSPRGGDLNSKPMNDLENQLKRIVKVSRGIIPQFFDSHNRSMLAQLPELVKTHAGASKRNFLCMGSGFYDGTEYLKTGGIPPTIEQVIQTLREKRPKKPLLTQAASIDIFVNPLHCQAVAESLLAFEKRGWGIRVAKDPQTQGRSLHAKFIFCANYRNYPNTRTSGWLYLGSGNFSSPGFRQKMKANRGNLEAGIVTAVERITDEKLCRVLPVQWEDSLNNIGPLGAGDPWEDRADEYIAPPVACFLFIEKVDGEAWLRPVDRTTEDYTVISSDGVSCEQDIIKGFHWIGPQPGIVKVCWSQGTELLCADVPVMDEYGRICGTPTGSMDLQDAWSYLTNFPSVSIDDDDEADDESDNQNDGTGGGGSPSPEAQYPIRLLMQFIEQIADQQQMITVEDWAYWCNRMEQYLIAAKDSPAVIFCQELELNVLGPLWHSSFRPDFAKDQSSKTGRKYEEVLLRIAEAWNVVAFQKLGGEI